MSKNETDDHRQAIVTGATRGIGLEVTKGLLAQGYRVIGIGSDAGAGKSLEQFLQAKHQPFSFIKADFANLSSVERIAERILSPWSLLINNAGIKIQPSQHLTSDGFERHLQINYLSHFLLTARLWPLASAQARVVSVSSIVAARNQERHRREDFTNLVESSAGERYRISKLLNLMFAQELSKRLDNSSKTSVAAHPGFTRASKYGPAYVRPAEYLLAQSAAKGAEPILSAAIEGRNGDYLAPKWLQLWGSPQLAPIPKSVLESDPTEAWCKTERLLGISFDPQ